MGSRLELQDRSPYGEGVRLLLAFGLISALVFGATPATAQVVQPGGAEEAVRDYAHTFATPGVAAAVVTPGAVDTVVSGRDGSGAAITPQTRFRIASMSKSMTATAIMLLVQDGVLALTDPVVERLPEFSMADPRHTEITIRQLLSHTSGLSLAVNDEFALPAPRTTAAVVAELADRRLAAAPGSRFEYHNTNYSLAARIVEVASGRPFDEFLRTRLFEPLGMHATTSRDACDAAVDGLPQGYSVVLGFAYPMPEMPGRCGGNGGVVSTLDDMVRWIRFNQGVIGTHVLRSDLLDELHTVSEGAAPFALGWQRREPSDGLSTEVVFHGGTMATFTGSMGFAPSTGTGAVVLTNGVGSPGELVTALIADVDGGSSSPFEDPLNTVNAILFALCILSAVLLTLTVLRSTRWAVRRRAARHPRLLLRLVPLMAVVLLGVFVPLLHGLLGGTINWQYWVIDVWLFPLLALLGLLLVVGGVSALVSRIVALRVVPSERRTQDSAPAQAVVPVPRTPVSPEATGPRART